MLSRLRLNLGLLPVDRANYGCPPIMNVVDPWIQRILVPLGLLPFVVFNGGVFRMKARDGKSLSGPRTVFEPLSTLNPSQIEVIIDDILNALPQPSRLPRISGEGEGLQLLLVVSLNCILSKLLG